MVLAGLDLRVDEGELYGLIGPNGAGKTTALRVALGLLRADAGEVRLLGRDPRSAAGARPRRVGSLIEAPSLSPRLTGREYLVLIARWAHAPDAEVDRVVGLLGLGRMTDRPTATYSSGMRQVLATAAALVGPPDLLVLDEPTVGLDPGHRRRVNDLLSQHVARGGTVLLSSHQLDDAERLCTRVGLMAAGRLVSEGRPDRARPGRGPVRGHRQRPRGRPGRPAGPAPDLLARRPRRPGAGRDGLAVPARPARRQRDRPGPGRRRHLPLRPA